VLALVACSAAPQRIPADAELPALVAALEARPRPQTFSVYARVESYSDSAVRKGKILLLGRAPGSLLLRALSFTDDALSTFRTDGVVFSHWDRQAGTCQQGRLCPRNLERFLPLPPETLLALFSGGWPLPDHCRSTASLWRQGPDLLLQCPYPTGGGLQEVTLDAKTLLPRKMSGLDGGGKPWRVELGQWRTQEGLAHPERIRSHSRSGELLMDIRQFQANPELSEDAFVGSCPEGLQPSFMECE
jgi:hypothetical protein